MALELDENARRVPSIRVSRSIGLVPIGIRMHDIKKAA